MMGLQTTNLTLVPVHIDHNDPAVRFAKVFFYEGNYLIVCTRDEADISRTLKMVVLLILLIRLISLLI